MGSASALASEPQANPPAGQAMVAGIDARTGKLRQLSDAEVAELILKPDSKVCKKDVRELSLPDGMTIAGVVRDGEGMLVKGDTRLQPGDHVCVFCLSGVFHTVEKYFSK